MTDKLIEQIKRDREARDALVRADERAKVIEEAKEVAHTWYHNIGKGDVRDELNTLHTTASRAISEGGAK